MVPLIYELLKGSYSLVLIFSVVSMRTLVSAIITNRVTLFHLRAFFAVHDVFQTFHYSESTSYHVFSSNVIEQKDTSG